MPTVSLLLLISAASLPQDAGKLVEQLRSESIVIRDDAVGELLKLGTAAIPALEKAVRDPDREVASRARTVLRWIRISVRLTPGLKKRWPKLVNRLASGNEHTWTEVFHEAIKEDLPAEDLNALAGPAVRGARDADEKKELCLILRNKNLFGAAPELRRLLSDPHAGVVTEALSALRVMHDHESIPAIRPLLQSDVGSVRARAARTLGWLGAREVIPQLTIQLGDENAKARGSAAYALGQLGASHTLLELRRLLRDSDSDVRGAAADAVGLLNDTGAAEEIRRMLTLSDQWIVWHAALAAGKLRDQAAVPRLIALLEHHSPNVRIAAVMALAHMGDERHVEPMLPLLDDIHVRPYAAMGLCFLGSSRGVSPLFELSSDFTSLNVVRNRALWLRLHSTRLEDDLRGPRRDLIRRVAELSGLAVSVPEGHPSLDRPLWIGANGLRTSLIDALSDAVPPSHEWILEPDRIRILPKQESRRFWMDWWKARKNP